MRKIFGICICLILIVAAVIAPTVAFAANSANAGVTIHFLNPTAVAVVGNNLLVADNIDATNSAIHCFDVSGNEAKWLYSQSLTEKIVNLSAKDNGSLYVVFSGKIAEYAVSSTKLTETSTISNYTNPVDVTYGADLESRNEYVLTDSALYRKNASGTANSAPITGTKSCIAIGDFIYYLYTENGADVCKSYDGKDRSTPSLDSVTTDQAYLNSCKPSDSNYFLKNFHAKGLFVWENDKVAIFNGSKISCVKMGSVCYVEDIFNYQSVRNQQITDVATSTDRLYVLNDNYQVDIFQKSEATFTLLDTIGDDTVYQQIPTNFTSFTLVRSNGYPTNLVYKTSNAATSVDDIIKNATEYVILGFDGDKNSAYYYVLVGDKFGWVQKSDGATLTNGVGTDANLTIVNTAVGNPSTEYVTKFNSLNAVYVYELPREASTHTTFTQTASTMLDVKVTVLQKFTETTANGTITWYYVSFEVDGTTHKGFVKKEHLAEFAISVDENHPIVGDKKINSTLFEAVKVYLYSDPEQMTDENLLTVDEVAVKLYSGKRVTVLSEENGVAFVQFRHNGSLVRGYVYSDRLIGLNAMTTNAIVGLSLLAAAIVITVTLVLIFVKRRKANSVPRQKKETKSED